MHVLCVRLCGGKTAHPSFHYGLIGQDRDVWSGVVAFGMLFEKLFYCMQNENNK